MIKLAIILAVLTAVTHAELASCCTTWNADCYLTASAENYNHACSAVEHCDGLCSSLSAKSGDLAAYYSCEECCQQYDHEVAWNCPKLEKASCCTTWNAECYTTASPANHDHACVSSGVMGMVHCGNDCADVLSTECEECCTGLSWHENDWNCELEDEVTTPEAATEECIDTDNGATDDAGDACDVYKEHWCSESNSYADDDFDFMTMCCVCGGGSTGGSSASSTKTCQYVAIDTSECLNDDWVCNSLIDEYYFEEDGQHYDYDCKEIGQCPMDPNDAFEGMICEADAKGYMGAKPAQGSVVDKMDRPVGTKHDENNCKNMDVYKVDCTSTLDIADFDCSYVPVAEEDCNDDWNCYYEYDEEEGFPLNDCGAINVCPMVIDDMSLDGMYCEADKNTDGVTPEGTSADLNNCKMFDVYQVVCVAWVPGCTDPDATNYNSAATLNDGSCIAATTTAVETTEATETTAVETTEAPTTCVDTDNGATNGMQLENGMYMTCADIPNEGFCQWTSNDDDDFVMAEMCCICGGGSSSGSSLIDVCADYEKKPCKKVYSDECMWSAVTKSCVSNDWTPVCSDFTSDKTKCKRLIKMGYACEWSAKKCQATDAVCVPGWIEVELLKQKDNKTKIKYVSSIEDCIAFATDDGAQGVIYEPNSSQQKCSIFATVGDYHPGTSGSADEVIWFNETC